MKLCYIVGAGDFYGELAPDESDLVIAADGGYDTLSRLGVRCDLLVGDLDSIESAPKGVELVRHPVRKDETDMLLCFAEGARRGYTEFVIYGGTGGREDHTFANYSLLLYIKEQGCNATLIGKNNHTCVIKNEKVNLCGNKGKHLSVFAFGAPAHGVTLRGLEYEGEGLDLYPAFALGVSNMFRDTPAEVEVLDGALLIMTEL